MAMQIPGSEYFSSRPVDPAVLITSRSDWKVGDELVAQEGSRWRICTIEDAHPELAARVFEAILTVVPMD